MFLELEGSSDWGHQITLREADVDQTKPNFLCGSMSFQYPVIKEEERVAEAEWNC
jgi:hypothetical protein